MAHFLRFNNPLDGQGDQASFTAAIPMEVGDRFELDAVIPSTNVTSALFLVENSSNYFAFNGSSSARIRLDGTIYTGDTGVLSPYIDTLTTYEIERFADRYEIRAGGNILISQASTRQMVLVRWGQGGASGYVNMDFYEGRFYSGGILAHRWIPSGTGLTIADSVGSNDLTLENFATDDSQYVEYTGFRVDQDQVSPSDSITWTTGLTNLTGAYLEDANGNQFALTNVTDTGGDLPSLTGNMQACLFGEVDITVTDGTDTVSTPINLVPPAGYELTTLASVPASPLSTDWVYDFDASASIGDQSLESNAVITHNDDGSITWTPQALTYTYYTVRANGGMTSEITKVFEEGSVVALPTVNAGNNINADDGDTVTLSGASASNYANLVWTCTSGQSPTITNAGTLTPTVTFNEDGVHTLRLTATNTNGDSVFDELTATVAAVDTTKPVITLLGNASVTITEGSSYTDAGATALDDTDGDITANITTVNPVDINTPATYTVTYNVSDAAGNAADEVTRTVIVEEVVDNVAPVVTNNGPATLTITVGDSYTPDFSTNEGTLNISNPVDTNTAGTYTVTATATDAAGNVGSATQIVIVEAVVVNQPPNANAGTNQSVTAGTLVVLDGTGSTAVSPATITGYTWTQIAGDTVTLDLSNPARPTFTSPTTNNVQTITHTLAVTDSNGLTSTADTVSTIVAADTVPPVITLLGQPSVTITQGESYVDAGAIALDNIDGDLTSSIVTVNPVNTSNAGNYTITYNVSDGAGNNATEVTRSVTVEALAPTIESTLTVNYAGMENKAYDTVVVDIDNGEILFNQSSVWNNSSHSFTFTGTPVGTNVKVMADDGTFGVLQNEVTK